MSLEWILLGLRILATMVLYGFLTLAFYIIWRDLTATETQATSHRQVRDQLRVLATAADSSFDVGDVLPLQPVTTIGRDPDNTIVLSDPSIAERHARISRQEGVWWIEDLGSELGTTLNDLPVSKPTSVAHRDRIGIGNLRVQVECT